MRDIKGHFDQFESLPIDINKQTDFAALGIGSAQARSIRHYYSDNNACFRRSVWESIPYPDVEFGEDQLWADAVVRNGYSKLYSSQAVVAHSHDYGPEETFERSKTESIFFKEFFGIDCIDPMASDRDIESLISSINQGDAAWGWDNGIDPAVIEERLQCNRARIHGLVEGARS